MKSSLKFTAIALLLGGVLHIQSLDAATSDGVNYDLAINPFAERVRGIFASSSTSREFATSIEALSRATSNTNQDKRLLLHTLVGEVLTSERPLTFFEEAFADESVKAKVFMAACIGAKRGSSSISGLREELDVLTSKLGKRTDEIASLHEEFDILTSKLANRIEEIASLHDEVNELSDETELLQRDVNDLSDALDQAQQTLQSADVRAFMPLTVPSAITPVEELAVYTVVASKPSTLPLAEQVFLLKVRENLGDPAKLGESIAQLDTLMRFIRNIASDVRTPENLARSALLRDVIPQVQAIAPIVGGYMQSILGQVTAINTEVRSRSGMLWAGTPTQIQTLQLSELDARKNLAYSVFDALFGTMTKPVTVPAAVDFRTDQTPANVLAKNVQTLHATLPVPVTSSSVIVKSDGSIAFSGGVDFSTGTELSSEYMMPIQTATAELLSMVLGAQTLVGGTLATSSVTGFAELELAKASLLPPPLALLAGMTVDLDTSSDSEGSAEGTLVVPVKEQETTA